MKKVKIMKKIPCFALEFQFMMQDGLSKIQDFNDRFGQKTDRNNSPFFGKLDPLKQFASFKELVKKIAYEVY